MTSSAQPIRVIFLTKDGQIARTPDGSIRDKLWTADGHHWLKSDGAFPYTACEMRFVSLADGVPAALIAATPT